MLKRTGTTVLAKHPGRPQQQASNVRTVGVSEEDTTVEHTAAVQ